MSDIRAIENIIRMLYECLDIYDKNFKFKEYEQTLRDLAICKKELKKLIAAKEIKNDAIH